MFSVLEAGYVMAKMSPLAPNAIERYKEALAAGRPLLDQLGVNTPIRLAHFLAQIMHESGGLTIFRENMNYSGGRLFEIFGVNRHSVVITREEAFDLAGKPEAIAERVYGLGNPRKARELGNTNPGDGFLYRGNGLMQTTGRGAHRELGALINVDFEANPELVTTAEYALQPAIYEWNRGGLNRYADKNDIRTITRMINGGFNGLEDRRVWFNRIYKVLSPGEDPIMGGEHDPDVMSLQHYLNELGASPKLTADGRYGPITAQAVKNFQADACLLSDGIAGPVTLAAIKLKLGMRE